MDNIIRCKKCYFVWHHCKCPLIVPKTEIQISKPQPIICHICLKNITQCVCCERCKRARCICSR